MRVTVAIPTYNRAELLRQTLAGIARQDFPAADFEVLVIDNNSQDGTAAVVAEFAQAQPAPRHVLERQQGLDHARNRALAEARGEIILFGDDDILVEPDWVARMIAPWAGATGGRIGAVGGEVIPVFPHGRPDWIAEWHGPLAFRAEGGAPRPEPVPRWGPTWLFPGRSSSGWDPSTPASTAAPATISRAATAR